MRDTILMMQRCEGVIEDAENVLELAPGFPWAHFWRGKACPHRGQLQEALADFEKISLPLVRLGYCGQVHAMLGDAERARMLLEELDRTIQAKRCGSFYASQALLGMGDVDGALDRLEAAYEERAPAMYVVCVDPVFDPLRGKPRFRELMRKVGLEP